MSNREDPYSGFAACRSLKSGIGRDDFGFGTVASTHLGRVGLDLMLARLAPDDKADLGSGGAAERHRRAGLGFHLVGSSQGRLRVICYRTRFHLSNALMLSNPRTNAYRPANKFNIRNRFTPH
jgi:hypothetical protein